MTPRPALTDHDALYAWCEAQRAERLAKAQAELQAARETGDWYDVSRAEERLDEEEYAE
jgi:lipocalin